MSSGRTVACRVAAAVLIAAVAACSRAPDDARSASGSSKPAASGAQAATAAGDAHAAESGIAWEKGDVDAAFAKAREADKPLFLYWGAVWCPPCNQVKATIFNRQDFIERSRAFIPVYLDGDSKSAQRQGARFKVGGYPTMILFAPDGSEITRLPGEVDAEAYMRVLQLGMNRARPVKATLAAALAGSDRAASLTADDWRMLAYYSWDTDEQALVAKDDVAKTLRRLADACPLEEAGTAMRLRLRAIVAAVTAPDAKPRDDRQSREYVVSVLGDPEAMREHLDLVTSYAGEIVAGVTLPKSSGRASLIATWDAAMQRLATDPRIAPLDRLSPVAARVALAKVDDPKARLAPELLTSVRDEVKRSLAAATNPYAHEAMVSSAAYVLREAGLLDESDALLTAELPRSATPYYLMLGLASNAKRRGDKAAAIQWAGKAYTAASGPATRLQWGTGYVSTLVDLAPEDATRIEQVATQVIGELEPAADTFYDRNRKSLERMATKLVAWNKGGAHRDAVKRIRAELDAVCAKLPKDDPAHAACTGVWTAKASAEA